MPVNAQHIPLPTVKKWAKTLQKKIPDLFPEIKKLPLSQSQEIIAQVLSYRNWQELSKAYDLPEEKSVSVVTPAPSSPIQTIEEFIAHLIDIKLGRVEIYFKDNVVSFFDSRISNLSSPLFTCPISPFAVYMGTHIVQINSMRLQFMNTFYFVSENGELALSSDGNGQGTLWVKLPYSYIQHNINQTIQKDVDFSCPGIHLISCNNPEDIEQTLFNLADQASQNSSCFMVNSPLEYAEGTTRSCPPGNIDAINTSIEVFDKYDIIILNLDYFFISHEILHALINKGKTIILGAKTRNKYLGSQYLSGRYKISRHHGDLSDIMQMSHNYPFNGYHLEYHKSHSGSGLSLKTEKYGLL